MEESKVLLFTVLINLCLMLRTGNAQLLPVRQFGESCDSSNLCTAIQFGGCNNGFCQCDDGYVHSGGVICLKETDEWQGYCSETVQCHNFRGAECVQKRCDCLPNFHYYENQCWTTRHLADDCDNNNECYLSPHQDRIECREEICRCKSPYKISDTGDDCNGGSTLMTLGLVSLLLSQLMRHILY